MEDKDTPEVHVSRKERRARAAQVRQRLWVMLHKKSDKNMRKRSRKELLDATKRLGRSGNKAGTGSEQPGLLPGGSEEVGGFEETGEYGQGGTGEGRGEIQGVVEGERTENSEESAGGE